MDYGTLHPPFHGIGQKLGGRTRGPGKAMAKQENTLAQTDNHFLHLHSREEAIVYLALHSVLVNTGLAITSSLEGYGGSCAWAVPEEFNFYVSGNLQVIFSGS